MQKLSGEELAMLINVQVRCSRALEYLPAERECVLVSTDAADDVPWFVVWLCSLYNTKFRHTMRAPPKLDSLRADLVSFADRLRWRWCKRKETDQPVARIKLPSVWCNEVIAPELEAWRGFFRKNVLRAAS